MSFEPASTLLTGMLLGAIGMAFVFSFVLPDPWSMWLALRKNLPYWVGPLGFVMFVVFLTYYLGAVQVTVLPLLPWVGTIGWIALGLIAVSAIVFFIGRRRVQETKEAKPEPQKAQVQ